MREANKIRTRKVLMKMTELNYIHDIDNGAEWDLVWLWIRWEESYYKSEKVETSARKKLDSNIWQRDGFFLVKNEDPFKCEEWK